MSLVAYDNDSNSDDEETFTDTRSRVTLFPKNIAAASACLFGRPPNNDQLFTKLPPPKAQAADIVDEEMDEFLDKKEMPAEKPKKRQPVKIGIPSLSEFDSDDDEPSQKKLKISKAKMSGLFAVLPPPKVTPVKTTSFIPNVVQKKVVKQAPTKAPKSVSQTVVTSSIKKIPAKVSKDISDSEDDDDDDEPTEIFDDETWQKVCGKQKQPARFIKQGNPIGLNQNSLIPVIEPAPDASKPYSGLDNRAFKELVGSSTAKKMNTEVDVIDIHEDEIRPDKEEWLKSLTDPNFEPEPAAEETVNNTCKVKNHITSLAQKALANDKELQMRWAESRHNRMQSRSKYGF